MKRKNLLLMMLMAFAMVPLAMNAQGTIKANRPMQFDPERGRLEMNGQQTNRGDRETTYDLVTASQTDWSGNYVLVGPWSTTTGYAFNGEVDADYHQGGITAVTIDGTSLSSIGDAPVLTIAKSTVNSSYYSIRINGGDYLSDGTNGLETSSTETEYYWQITYTSNGMQIYCPRWNGGPYYLYFVVYQNTSTSNYGALFATCQEGDFTTEGYTFEYDFPVLYKETTSGGGQGDEVTIGSGTTTNNYLPTYAYYGNTLSQQIYTASEVGQAGTITHIAYYVASNASQRTVDIYMSHTTKSTFSSTSDWVTQGTNARVVASYSTFASTGWNVIPLSSPFEYNGTDNLLITVNDITNSWVSSYPKFYVYSTGSNRAHYTFQDNTNFNPASITASSNNSLVTSNNQIKLTIVHATNYTITLNASPAEGGTVSGDGTYAQGTQVELTATANSGYSFAGWQLNGSTVSTDNPYTITVTEDATYTAVFTSLPQYTVTVNAATGGTVTGGGTYYQGEQATLTATANSGYAFAGWQLNGSTVSTANPYTITVNGNVTYTAVFETLAQHYITVTQATGGTISASHPTAYMGDVITLSATPSSGYYFGEWIVKDASNNTITVTNNQFTMPNSDVTVTATFTQGFQVTLNQTPNGTISADQTTNLHPGDHVTLTATPDAGCVFLAWYAYETGNPRDVVDVISNTTILMPASDVTIQAIFVTEEEHEAQLGSGTSTNQYIPTYVRARYSLTQQIYLASELENQEGRITKIAYRATTVSATRNLDIYIRHTDQSSFSSTNDWTTMGPSFKVFSGNVAFGTSDWTTITLDTPFEYDGTSNIIICVVDNTGSTAGSNSSYTQFYRYSATNRALYANGTSAYSNVNVSNITNYTGTRISYVNRINITMMVPGSAESLTLSPGEMTDFSYVEGQGPSEINKLDIVGVALSNDITVTAPTNFEVSLTEEGTYGSSVTVQRETGSKGNRNVTTWNFDNGLGNWTTVDADGDGNNWYSNTNTGQTHNSSAGAVTSASYASGALTPDNWLISPQVELGGTFTIWACPQDPAWPQEHFGIFVSTTNTNPSSFTMLNEWTCESGVWKQYSVDLRLYAGQTGYIAVRHFDCTDKFRLNVDDFELDTEATITIEMPVTITPATVFVRMKDNLNIGTYSGTLTASAGTGDNLNGSVSLSGEVYAAYNITLTANPTEGGSVAGAGTYASGTEVTVSARADSPYIFKNWTEDGEVVSTDNPYTFTVTGDRDLVANFEDPRHTLTIVAEHGTVTVDGVNYTAPIPLNENQTVAIVLTTDAGYDFQNWSVSGTDASVSTQYYTTTFTMGTTDATLTANFEAQPIQLDVEGYEEGDGRWYLFTSPLAGATSPEDVDNLFSDEDPESEYYDLYKFDQTQELEWRNYKQEAFDLVAGTGYLYANEGGATLYFRGTPYNGDGVITITNTSENKWHGWNLVGNPYNAEAWSSLPYYKMNGDGDELVGELANTNSLQPMEGFFVYSEDEEGTVTVSTTAPTTGNGKSASLVLNVSRGRGLLDRAIVSFGDSNTLPKFQLNPSHTKVYIPREERDYAIVSAEDEMGEMPVSFKAEKNGSYTISVTAEGVSFGYLHLIDNMTGNDVDLLQTPSYTFNALDTDYASRFKLVFATGNATGDNFAFYSNGSWVISNDGEATLQVIDVTGRVLRSESVNGCTSVNMSAAPGVYMLRLINGDNVKVQKVVVRR